VKPEPATLIVLTPGFAENEADTTCLPMHQAFIRELKKANPYLNISLLTLQYPYNKTIYKWFDIDVIPFGGKNKGGLSKLLLRQKVNQKMEQIITDHFVMGVLSFWCNECGLLGKRFADKHDIRHGCWILGQDAKKDNKYVDQMRPAATELIALSDFISEEFEKNHGVRPAHVIVPGVNLAGFSPSPLKKDIDLIGVGSLIPLKQFDVFIRIVQEIKKEFPGIKAVLAGKGPEGEKLEKLVVKYGLQESVTLAGELSHPETLQMMQRSRILLHPSSYEGFSGVCQEALAAGCDVISFTWAMKEEIPHWHVVTTEKQMLDRVRNLLQNEVEITSSRKIYSIEDTVKAIVRVFNYSEVIT
jgi:glycosyltransferase involved in cell wall biosynthesis